MYIYILRVCHSTAVLFAIFQKPNDLLLAPHKPSLIISSQGVIKLEDSGIMDSQQPNSHFIKTSPARDALSELLNMPPSMSIVNEESNDLLSSGDANSLIVDLNDLLKRDPTLSTLSEDNLAVDTSFDFMNTMNNLAVLLKESFLKKNIKTHIDSLKPIKTHFNALEPI